MSRFTKVDQKSLLKKKKRLYFGLGIIATLIVAISLTLFFSFKDTGAAWWNDNWMYRKLVPVTNNTTEESNVYISVTIDTSDTDKFQGDCGDLRFTKYNGELLPYYIISGCGTASTSININFNTFPAGPQNIYYYYGNPSTENGFSSSNFSTEATNYSVGSFGSEEATPGPVAYWKFDEGYGNVANDSTQNQNDGTISNATWASENQCISRKCLAFDGNANYVNTGNNSSLNPTDEVTVSMWVRNQRDTGKHTFLIRKASGTGGYGLYQSNTETVSFFIYWASGSPSYQFCTASNYTLPQNQWTHISGQFKQDNYLKIYINGVEKGSCSPLYSDPIGTSGNDLLIGQQGWWGSDNAYFKGFIDNVKIYPYARSAEEIKIDYLGSAQVLGIKDESFLSEGLIGYWKLDESASPAIDSSGRSYSATWNGNAAASSGKYGNGIVQTDGGGGYLSVSDTGDPFDMGTNNFSISMWFKLDSLSAPNAPELLDKMVSATTGYHLRVAYSDEVEFQVKGAGGNIEVNSANSAIQTDRWYHVVAVYDKKNGHKIYLDGAQSGSTVTGDAGNIDNTDALRIGMGFNSWEMDGTYDETRIYNRALSSTEIAQLYSWAPGPTGYWNFDEKTGTTANDISGNGNTGTLTNSPTWDVGKFGGGVRLTTANKYVDVPTFTPNITNDSMTFGAWVNISLGGVQRIFSDKAQGYPHIGVTGTTLFVHTKTSSGTDTNLPYTALPSNCQSGWHHIAVTWDASLSSNNVKAYCDGVNFTSATLVNAIDGTFNFASLKIGHDADTQSLNGLIDDVRIYNYARTPAQIIEDMNIDHPIPGSPIGSQASHLKFDEGYGTTAYDVGYNNDDGILTDGPSWTNDGKFRKALDFDGLNDRVQGFAADPLEYTGEDLTLSVWINQDSGETTNGDIITKAWNGSGQYNYRLYINSNDTLTFSLVGTTGWSTSTTDTIDTGNWHHIVISVNGATDAVNIYIDGKLSKSDTYNITSWTPSSGDNNVSLCIGSLYPYNSGWGGNTTYSFDGKIDEIKIYTAALTQSQVLLDMNQGVSQVFGATSTDSSGNADWSAAREYCVPGDTTSCSAPIGEWKFDEGSTGTSYDSSSNGNTGTDTGTTIISGKIGKGRKFNGSSDYVNVTDNANLRFGTGNFTIGAWIKFPISGSNAWEGIVSKGYTTSAPANTWGLIRHSTFTNGIAFQDTTDVGGAFNADIRLTSISDGWHHFTVSRSGTSYTMYEDGILVASQTKAQVNLSTTADIKFGSDASPRYFQGNLDHVKIYDYARTPAQVVWDYNRGGPVGWWKMDECQGETANDSSGNGNNGTITIGATVPQTAVGTCDTASTAWGNGATGKYHSSLNFDGADDYVYTADSPSLDMGTMTVSAWIKTSNSSEQCIVERNNSTFYFCTNSGKLRYYINGVAATWTASNKSINDSAWHHVLATWDGTNKKLYIDGQLDITEAGTGGDIGNTAVGLNIGVRKNAGVPQSYFDGQIDDVKLYNYSMTTAQIKTLYNGGGALYFGP